MKVKIFRFLSALVKIYQIHHAVFETMSQFFFSVMKNNSSDTSVSLKITPLYILGQTLYTLHKRDTEQWCKIWINLALWFQKWHEELDELSLEHSQKSEKNGTLIGSFYPKHLMFQLGNFIRIMCHNTEGWCKN